MFFSLVIFLPKILLGFSVAHLIWKNQTASAHLLKLALGVPLGMGISSLGMFACLAAGISIKIYGFVEIFFSLGLFMMVLYFRHNFQSVFLRLRQGVGKPERYFLLVLAFAFVPALSAFYLYAQKSPHGFEDAWLLWNLSARYIYRAGDISFLLPAAKTFRSHPDYPLLVSLNIAWGWNILRTDTTRVQMIVAALFTFSIPAILFASIKVVKDVFQAVIVALIALMTPWLIILGTWQYADIPLAVYFLASGVMLFLYLRTGETGTLVLSGLLAGFSAWTKNEGLLFLLVTTTVLCLILFINGNIKKFVYFLSGFAAPLIILITYRALVKAQTGLFSNGMDILTNVLDGNRYGLIFTSFVKEMNTFGGWPVGIWLILVIYGLIVGIEKSEKINLIGIFLLLFLQISGYFVIYLVTPYDLNWHLATSLSRLLAHLYPLGLFLYFIILKSPIRIFGLKN